MFVFFNFFVTTSGECSCFQVCLVNFLEGRSTPGKLLSVLAYTLYFGIILWWSGYRLYPAIFWCSYIYFSGVSQALANSVTLSADFIVLVKLLLIRWSYSTCIEAFKLKTRALNEFSEDNSLTVFFNCIFLFDCILQLLSLKFSIFLALKSVVTRENKLLSFSMPLSTGETMGMTVKKIFQSEESCYHRYVSAGCYRQSLFSLLINLNEDIKQAGWVSSKELHLPGRNNKVIPDPNNHVCNGSFNTKERCMTFKRSKSQGKRPAWTIIPEMTVSSLLVLFSSLQL